MLSYVIIGVAFIGTLLASYTDIKTREVPNELSFGLIFAMIGLRILYAYVYQNFMSLWMSLLAGGIFLLLGVVFFYTQQWGGADTKLLIAMGVGFGVILPDLQPMFVPIWPFFLGLLLNFFIIAVIYAVIYAFIMAAKNPKVGEDFKASLNKYETLIGSLFFVLALVLSFYYTFLFWLFLIPLLWFLSKFLKSVEKNCMVKKVNVKDLVEFDIPEKDIVVDGNVLVSKKEPNGMGLEQVKQIQELAKKGKISKNLVIKWGVPLIPVFPITILVSVFFGDIMFWLLSHLP